MKISNVNVRYLIFPFTVFEKESGEKLTIKIVKKKTRMCVAQYLTVIIFIFRHYVDLR